MNKRQAKIIAMDVAVEAIRQAYYLLADDWFESRMDITEEDLDKVQEQLDLLGDQMENRVDRLKESK